jgi:hypothetical protein
MAGSARKTAVYSKATREPLEIVEGIEVVIGIRRPVRVGGIPWGYLYRDEVQVGVPVNA